MEQVLSRLTVSISEFRKEPSEVIRKSAGEAVAILSHNKPAAYLVSPDMYERFLEALDDIELGKIIEQRQGEKARARKITLDDL